MDHRAAAPGASPRVAIVGLGPGDLDRLPAHTRELLTAADRTVIVRTLEHPAAGQLAERRAVESCDDLYRSRDRFEDVYRAIADRVRERAEAGPVVYAVPGSPSVGELAVGAIRRRCADLGVEVQPGESFLDLVWEEVGVDPLLEGFALLDGHHLPDPLGFQVPTVIAHLDLAETLADVAARLDRILPDGAEVTLLAGLGSADQVVVTAPPAAIDPTLAGNRTSLYVPPTPAGVAGAVAAMRRLRVECPWDREQTHHSLVRYLVEETAELADALAGLPAAGDDPDWVAYDEVEDELGDVLLQVLFHAQLAKEAGAFDVDDVAARLREKLVRRHPHVFGEVEVADADEVKRNWEAIKAGERDDHGGSLLEGIPTGLPALARADKVQRRVAKVGFDWRAAASVVEKLREELEELEAALDDPEGRFTELGDLAFTLVNLARHLEVEPEAALRAATRRFEDRFRRMEAEGSLEGLDLAALDARWERAKQDLG